MNVHKTCYIKIGFMTSLIQTFLLHTAWDDCYWTLFPFSISLDQRNSFFPSGDHFWLIFVDSRKTLYRNLKIKIPTNPSSPNLAQLKVCLHTTVDFFLSVHVKSIQKLKITFRKFSAVCHNNFDSLEAAHKKRGAYVLCIHP